VNAPLVFVEVRGGRPTLGSVGLLAVARSLAGDARGAAAFVAGPGAGDVASTLGGFGADETWYAEDASFDESLGVPRADAIARLIEERGYRTIMLENSVLAIEIAARLGVRLGAGVDWDLLGLEERDGELVGRRLALGDSVAVEVGWTSDVRIAVFRLGALEPVEAEGLGNVHRWEPAAVASPSHGEVRVVERSAARSGDAARLAGAGVIVAGGRGVRDRESMRLLEDLADALGGVVGVSLPIADRGWYPHSRQVGQTGQKVRPRLYVACGISGALAHRTGMEKSETIVAINDDPTAPIFGLCDAGVVGDLHTVVPQLTALVRDARAAPTQGGPLSAGPPAVGA
jgi:electron transfer flavoprotein alpha subunit